MQFREQAIVSPDLIQAINSADQKEILTQLENYQKEISSLLTSYHYSERGSVHASQILPESIIIASGNHIEFKTAYKTQHRYACDGITHEYDRSMKISVEANLENSKLTFTGEFWPERDGDEF